MFRNRYYYSNIIRSSGLNKSATLLNKWPIAGLAARLFLLLNVRLTLLFPYKNLIAKNDAAMRENLLLIVEKEQTRNVLPKCLYPGYPLFCLAIVAGLLFSTVGFAQKPPYQNPN